MLSAGDNALAGGKGDVKSESVGVKPASVPAQAAADTVVTAQNVAADVVDAADPVTSVAMGIN